MQTRRQQQGMTMIGWILVAAVVGFLATFGLKLIPMYLQQSKVDNVLQAVQKDFEAGGANPRTVRESVATKFAVNDIRAIKSTDVIVRTNDQGQLVAGFQFEQRSNFMANIDLVMTYENFVEVKGD